MEMLTYIFICALFVIGVLTENSEDYILCANSIGSIAYIAEDGAPEQIPAESYQKCKSKNNYCYTLWLEDSNNGSVEIMAQGCWEQSGNPSECDRTECLADKKPPKAMNHTKFCCCSQSRCNANFTDAYVPGAASEDDPAAAVDSPPSKDILPLNPAVYAAIAALFAAFVATVTAAFYVWWRSRVRDKKKGDVEGGGSGHCRAAPPPPAEYSLDRLKLLDVIGQGRYGCVWRGQVDDREVAVKVFPAHHRNYYVNERDVYAAAGEHPALLRCFGGGEWAVAGPGIAVDYLLLLGLEQGCLQDYLRENILDLTIMAKMSLSIAKGLAHLHSDLGKPCIAHRDFNSRNILVKHDLSCCICDLGLAVIPKRAENKSISEAGTLRYMAPEVLEGAVNLRDCQTALKQIDIYALGLVLWELGTRCVDLQNSSEPPPYAPPFTAEAGDKPTLERMQSLVSRRKARPVWPPSWRESSAAARLVAETAEDCWDQDAEARLTSLCVVERLLELPTLKGRSSRHPPRPPASPAAPLVNNNHLHDHQIDASVTTVETLLSPSEEHCCKNSNRLAACVTPLQPYQGRNPCLERNLLSGSSDSMLIDKSSKHCSNTESQNLIVNDFLNFQINHRATPIPYLQNAVHGIPKQQNTNNEVQTSIKGKFKWHGFKKLFNTRKNPINRRSCKDTQVKLNSKIVNGFGQNGVTTSLLSETEIKRPLTLQLKSVTPRADATNSCGVSQIIKRDNSLSRQRSLEQFTEVFCSTGDLSRLRDPSQRVKTPGDVPPSVRRTRGRAAAESSARFSLYDDRMMTCRTQWWGSAPDLEPASQKGTTSHVLDLQDRDSMHYIPSNFYQSC